MRIGLRIMTSAAAAIACPFAGPATGQVRQPIVLDDINRIAGISDLAFAPDGTGIVYSLSEKSEGKDSRSSDLWFVPWAGGAPLPLTKTPDIGEAQPAFGGDGKWLFFISGDKGDGEEGDDAQLWRMPASGGAAARVSSVTGGISAFSLSPDGRRAVVVASVGSRVGSRAETPPPIVVDRFHFKEDGTGYLDDRTDQLFIVDLATGKAEQVTSGPRDHSQPIWSPDGKWIAFIGGERGEEDRSLDSNLFVMAPEGGEVRRISPSAGIDDSAAWSPDSRRLVWLEGAEEPWLAYAPRQLAVADMETGAISRPARIDRAFYDPRWSHDGKAILALVEEDRVTWLARIDAENGALTYLTKGKRVVDAYAVGPKGRIATLEGDVSRPPDLWAADMKPRPLTQHNRWIAERALGEVRDISFRSDDADIHGYVTLPPGHRDSQPLPTIMLLHGGPVYQFDYRFDINARLYAASGYAVVSINPRGSSGRGSDFSRAIWQNWGNLDVKDIRAGIDHVIATGLANPERLGVAGWSYGGVLANFMIASEPRLKAAISGAGIGNELSMFGVDMYAREYALEWGPPWRDPEIWQRVSYPFFHADRIKTPTMYQCGEKDDNVPCVGSDQMYLALKTLGVPTVLVVYPGESHEFAVPSYLVDRMGRNIAWMNRWLKNGGSEPSAATLSK